MQTLILSLHIIVCVILVILVLLQSGKEGMGVIFGGGNTSVFGSGGAGGILTKLTAFMAVLFVFTSLSYTYVTSEHAPAEKSVILDVKLEEIPARPAPAAPQSTAPASEAATAQPAKDATPPAASAPKDAPAAPAQAAPPAKQ